MYKYLNIDLDDVDSQVEVTALPPSDGGDTDSESEAGDNSKEIEEFPETPYVFAPEPEFGGVSTCHSLHLYI